MIVALIFAVTLAAHKVDSMEITGVPSEHVSKTALTPGASGEEVVDEVVAVVEKHLGKTHDFLKKVAWVESEFGEHPDTYRPGYNGGIFQVDKIGFTDTQNTRSHPSLKSKFARISSAFGITWGEVTWVELRKPLYSALAARLHLSNVPAAIPVSLAGQAKYWKRYYNTEEGAGSAASFIKRWEEYINRKGGKAGT